MQNKFYDIKHIQTNLGILKLKNPVVPASGTFGYGKKFQSFFDINKLGAVLTKSVTIESRLGNPQPRIYETPYGIMNSIGLENKGIDWFEKEVIPFLFSLKTQKWVSISGFTEDEFVQLTERLDSFSLDAIEVNVSCPNIHEDGIQFCQNQNVLRSTLRKVRKCTNTFLIAKIALETYPLTNAIRIISEEGFGAVCLGNTVRGLAIDIDKQKPFFKRIIAGLSGPAIKPIALRTIWEAYEYNPELPVIGCGGILTADDAIEFIMAGASVVEIGTANLIDPFSMITIIKNIEQYCASHNKTIKELIGIAH